MSITQLTRLSLVAPQRLYWPYSNGPLLTLVPSRERPPIGPYLRPLKLPVVFRIVMHLVLSLSSHHFPVLIETPYAHRRFSDVAGRGWQTDATTARPSADNVI